MMKKRSFIKNNHAVAHTIESLIAIGVTITLVFVFCYSIDTHYNAYDNKNITLKMQSDAISDSLISLQGLNSSYGTDWENGANPIYELRYLGFATNPTVEYGVIMDNKTISSGPYPKNYVGQTRTCFVAGTKIVMADGTYKDIETIVVGDTVKSFNEKNRQMEDKKVTKIFHHPPGEMGEYYLIINNCLRVTPNHKFYTEKGWIAADSLKIGDELSYSSDCNAIYSIEKVYEKVETYNFEVEENHNYFVIFDSKDVLAHNAGTTPGGGGTEPQPPGPPVPPVPPVSGSVNANFTWFDEDGLALALLTKVYFNSTSQGSITSYSWKKSVDGVNYDPQFGNTANVEKDFGSGRYYVKLTVQNSTGASSSIVKIVEANKLSAETDPEPWVLAGKNAIPDTDSNTSSSYGEGYYITYHETSPISNYKVYEVKEKKTPETPILSKWKIDYVRSLSAASKATLYQNMKTSLGLTSDKSVYNFQINIYIYQGGAWTPILEDFGASDQYVKDKVSVTRQVSIYAPPSCSNSGVITHPTYSDGKIIISTFLG